MPTKSSQSADSEGEAQLDKFKQASRDLDCDEEAERFEGKLKKIAKHEPKEEKPE